jgi:hypothetical protein
VLEEKEGKARQGYRGNVHACMYVGFVSCRDQHWFKGMLLKGEDKRDIILSTG